MEGQDTLTCKNNYLCFILNNGIPKSLAIYTGWPSESTLAKGANFAKLKMLFKQS
jgi:hypothetical protein